MKRLSLYLTVISTAFPLAACISVEDKPASEMMINPSSDNDSSLPPEAIEATASQHGDIPAAKDPKPHPPLTPDDIEADADPMKVVFETAKWDLSAIALGRIRDVADQMMADDRIKLKIDGHCDERGTDQYNQVLSEKRAHAVFLALRKMGISAKRMAEQGFGRRRAAMQGHTEKVYSHNRRVEMIFDTKAP